MAICPDFRVGPLAIGLNWPRLSWALFVPIGSSCCCWGLAEGQCWCAEFLCFDLVDDSSLLVLIVAAAAVWLVVGLEGDLWMSGNLSLSHPFGLQVGVFWVHRQQMMTPLEFRL
jgi:hypothetical protein